MCARAFALDWKEERKRKESREKERKEGRKRSETGNWKDCKMIGWPSLLASYSSK